MAPVLPGAVAMRSPLATLTFALLLATTARAQPADPAAAFLGEFTLEGGASLRAGGDPVHAGGLLRVRRLADGRLELEREGYVLSDPPSRARWTTTDVRSNGGALLATFRVPGAGRGLTALGGGDTGDRARPVTAVYWFEDDRAFKERVDDAAPPTPADASSIWTSGRRLPPGRAGQGPVETLVDHGPSDARFDLVIVSEGYTTADLPRFRVEADEVVERLRATPPFTQYWGHVNVHRVEVAAPAPGVPGGRGGPSALGTRVADGLPRGDRGRIMQAAAAAPGAEAVLVLVNDHFRSLAHVDFTLVSALDPRQPAVAVHELGHTIGFLLDEYEEFPARPWDFAVANGLVEGVTHWTGWGANLTTARTRDALPWRAWLTPGAPVPTPDGAGLRVGAYEGGFRFQRGWFRPSETCLMRDEDEAFCPVCREALVLRLSKHTRPYEVTVDRVDRDTVRLSVTTTIPGPARVSWVRNGLVTSEGPTYVVSRRRLPWGTSDLLLIVEDRTPWVKNDRLGWATFRARFQLDKGWLWTKGVKVEGPWPVAPREVEGEDLLRKLDRG